MEDAAMEMTGEQRIPAAQDVVWNALNDPEVLKACIPGCDSIEKQSDKARFNGKLKIDEANPPQGYSLVFEGSGGAAGFGKGRASVALEPEGAGTALRYTASAQVSGKLAQVGSRLIDGVAKKMAADFFERFNARFAPDPSADVGQEPTATQNPGASQATMSGAGAAPKTAARPWKTIAAVAVIVACAVIIYALNAG
jgi:carbon monoxide dehydrogenase subunit G